MSDTASALDDNNNIMQVEVLAREAGDARPFSAEAVPPPPAACKRSVRADSDVCDDRQTK